MTEADAVIRGMTRLLVIFIMDIAVEVRWSSLGWCEYFDNPKLNKFLEQGGCRSAKLRESSGLRFRVAWLFFSNLVYFCRFSRKRGSGLVGIGVSEKNITVSEIRFLDFETASFFSKVPSLRASSTTSPES